MHARPHTKALILSTHTANHMNTHYTATYTAFTNKQDLPTRRQNDATILKANALINFFTLYLDTQSETTLEDAGTLPLETGTSKYLVYR